MKKLSMLILLACMIIGTGVIGREARAGNASPWVGISNVRNMDVWRKGAGVNVALQISPPKDAQGKLDIKLYTLTDDGSEALALDMLSGHELGNAAQYTLAYTLPANLSSGMYMLRCSYDSGLEYAPEVTANAVVVILDAGQLYGWQGDMFYDIDGPAQNGIYAIHSADNNSVRYYCFQGGHAVSGLRSENGCTYLFDKNLGLQTGWQKQGGWRYFSPERDSYGEMRTGWLQDNGRWYYLDTKGETAGVMQTGWQKLGGQWYYLKSGGDMATGWQKLGNEWYYLKSSGAMTTGWQKIGGGSYGPERWYYFTAGGTMQTGWLKDGGKWYYLQSNGAMATSWQRIDGKWYYFGTGGVMQTGWQKVGSRWFYLDPHTGAMLTDTTVNGYKLGSDGAII